MWHEARRQERKIRGMLVDYRRRAERRRDFYEKIKADPTQFLQLHGRPCKIHLDSAVAAAADSPATMMPWQGQADNLIDRFDVRAHLDFIPPFISRDEGEPSYEERQCNYERYRILAQNSFLSINEEKFLKQLHLEEQFGYTAETEKDKKRKTGIAIGFNYDDPTSDSKGLIKSDHHSDDEEDCSDSDLDVDLCIDVSKVEQSQAHEMNKCGQNFGMCSNDFYSFLTNDMEEAENIRLAREEEHEKALFSGRKSRRERRAHREKRLANRILSPPSYAARDSPTYPAFRESKSRSKSVSPVNTGQITYITSFGDDEEPAPSTSKPSYADKVKYGKKRSEDRTFARRRSSSGDRKYRRRSTRSRSKSSYSRYRSRRSRTRSRSRRRSRNRRKRSYTRSRSRSRRRSRDRRSRSFSSSSSGSSKSSSSKSSSDSSRESMKREEPPKPIQRYYGRKVSDKSSSDLDDSTEDEQTKLPVNPAPLDKVSSFGNSGSVLKFGPAEPKMTPQERLKRKMQLLLNRQYKADKIAEQIRTERAQQEQRNREDELREMALKLRRKQRERRHIYDENASNNSSDSDTSSSRDRSTTDTRSKRSASPVSPRSRSKRSPTPLSPRPRSKRSASPISPRPRSKRSPTPLSPRPRSKRSPTPPSPRPRSKRSPTPPRRSSKEEERDRDRGRVRNKSPAYRSRNDYRYRDRDSSSPHDTRDRDRDYDDKRNRHRSLVDY